MQRSILLVLALLLCPSLALARTWTNREGKEIVADFVDATQEKVTLKKSDGKVVSFKLELLSDSDQQFIRAILARRVGKKTTTPSEEPGSPFESVAPEKPATDLRSAVESKGEDEKPEGLGTMRDVNETKKKMKAENREWTDAFGNKSSGKFIRFQGNSVLVLRSGRPMPLDYWQLSEADHEYLKELCAANGWSQFIPKVNPAEQRNNGPNTNVAGNSPAGAAGASGFVPGASNTVPGASNTPSTPPPGAFAGAAGASSPPPASSTPPRFGDPEELARRLRELEEKAKAAATYTPPPSSATAGNSTFPGASSSPPPSASASYSPPPGPSSSPPPSASASYSPPGASYTPPPSSSFPGSSMPSSSMPGSSIPSIPDPTFSVPSMTMEKQCENCNKVLPAHFTAGMSCPGCGVYFSVDRTTGKTASGGGWGGGGGGLGRGAIKGIIVLVVLAIKGIAFMVWRSQQS